MPVKINCPNCGRILGDTDESLKATLNCNSCKKHVKVDITLVKFEDYFKQSTKKEPNK